MTRRGLAIAATRSATALRSRLAEDVRRLMDDAGITISALAAESGLAKSFVARILAGQTRPSIDTYARLAAVLGADLSARLYPNTGPAIRDRHQARILEGLLEQLHPRWRPYPEVAVRRPARGWIDLVLHEQRERIVVTVEIQSELRRLEELVRWSREKTESLPSSGLWRELASTDGLEPDVSSLLLVRRTRTTARITRELPGQVAAAYPAHPDDAIAALTGTVRWPGSALVWAQIDATGVRLLRSR